MGIMKRFNILLVLYMAMGICKAPEMYKHDLISGNAPLQYAVFGKNMDTEGIISVKEMTRSYDNLAVTDSIPLKFKAKVTDVCKAKGCWMKLELEDGKEAMLRFVNYGFFVPKDITGKEVIVNGLAFVEEMSIRDQRHYAKDGGKSDSEIAKIIAPKRIYGFQADGVLLKE